MSRNIPGRGSRRPAPLVPALLATAVLGAGCSCPRCDRPCGPEAAGPRRVLRPGESATAEVCARRYWNRTGIVLVPDGKYDLTVEGEQCWVDWGERACADGYNRPWLQWARGLQRFPSANFFTLIGSVAQSPGYSFVIGKGPTHLIAQAGGELFCYANDVAFMYWNNRGSIVLTVRRVD